MTPWLQLINNCTALKHRLDFLFQFSFWRKFRSRSKKKISTIFWVWNYSLFCHQKLVPFGECIGLVFLFCFVLFFFCRCLFVFSGVPFALPVCFFSCLFRNYWKHYQELYYFWFVCTNILYLSVYFETRLLTGQCI